MPDWEGRSAAVRLAALYSLAFTLVTAALGVAIYFSMRAELRVELEERIRAERDMLLREPSAAALARALTARVARRSPDMRYAIVDPSATLVAGTELRDPIAPGWRYNGFREEDGGFDGARTLVTRLADGDMLVVGADPESIERLDRRMVPLFAVAFGLMAAVGVVGALALGTMLRRRVDAINGAAEAIIAGRSDARMPVGPARDEYDRLSTTLNSMLDRNAALMASLRQVSGDIAHDLRTPLSRLRQRLESALAGRGDAEALRSAMEGAVDQTDDMLALFAAILGISEVEARGVGLRMAPLDLSSLLGDIVDSYLPSAEDEGRALTRSIAPGLAIDGSRELVAQLIVNLLDNALRHTPRGTAIEVALSAEAAVVRLSVSDRGPGIGEADRGRVFERFARLDHSRSTPGHGLGLSLVAAIVAAHGGTVAVDDNHPGAAMIVMLPRRVA